MKPNRRIKIINGKEYWYEDTPYYDKNKKQIRYRSKYLGKNVNGEPVRIREELEKAIQKPEIGPAVQSYAHGHVQVIQDISKQVNLSDFLEEILPKAEADTVFALACNRVCRPLAMHQILSWYEGTTLSLNMPKLPLSSQRISELLKKIGSGSVPELFQKKIIDSLGTQATLYYDITSLSSYSGLMSLLEYGYNRDGDANPQINLACIVDKEKGIPVMYDIHPGSIVDMSTLKMMLQKIRAKGLDNYACIMDRGFFSRGNLEELSEHRTRFIIPASFQLKAIKELLNKEKKYLENPDYLRMYQKKTIFVKPVLLQLEQNEIQGYLYYDPAREHQEKENFYNRLYEMKEKLEEKRVPRWRIPSEVFKETARTMAPYLKFEIGESGQFKIGFRKNAISQRTNRMGKFLLLYHGEFDWETCLSYYREKDVVEESFNLMKNHLKGKPLNTQKNETTRGFIFIQFVSLILRMRLQKMMKDTGLLKKYTVEGALLELEKLTKVRLEDGSEIITPMTKKQREIFEVLQTCA